MSEDEVVQPVEGEGEAESEATEAVAVELEGAPKHRRIRHKPSKRHRKARAAVGSADPRPLNDAVQLLKGVTSAKFDESVELHLRLGVDTKKPDQQVRGTFAFPHGIGREKRVIAFAEGDMALECEAAGAVAVGGQDLAKKISDGWLDFDVVVAHPAMMRHIGRLGRVLGPRGLMPNPKAGTVTGNVPAAVAEFKAGKVEFRLDEGANIHLVVGKKSFEVNKLVENIEAFLAHLESVRPSGVRGTFMLRATVSSTMGPGVRVQISS